jgi:mono/diheme cytochrome c family protein
MKRFLKWTAALVLVLAAGGFVTFLYFIPPFLVASPETFSRPVFDAPPPTDGIADPKERAIAERGRELVRRTGCIGCHAMNGAQGPDYSKYLAGGGLKFETPHGTFVSRNLTPDPETGLARRTDADIKRVIRSGVFPDGRVTSHGVMPWADFSNFTEEDLHAIVVYLRHLPAVRNRIPDPDRTRTLTEAGVVERAYGGKNYAAE